MVVRAKPAGECISEPLIPRLHYQAGISQPTQHQQPTTHIHHRSSKSAAINKRRRESSSVVASKTSISPSLCTVSGECAGDTILFLLPHPKIFDSQSALLLLFKTHGSFSIFSSCSCCSNQQHTLLLHSLPNTQCGSLNTHGEVQPPNTRQLSWNSCNPV